MDVKIVGTHELKFFNWFIKKLLEERDQQIAAESMLGQLCIFAKKAILLYTYLDLVDDAPYVQMTSAARLRWNSDHALWSAE